MRVTDIIFALICGKVIGFVIGDILKELGVGLGFYENVILWLVFPVITLIFLWLAFVIGRKLLFVFQAAKHFLVGAFATVVDLKLFELLGWFLGAFIFFNPLVVKGASFIVSTLIKYWGNKYWAFAKPEKENLHKEIAQFFAITLLGLAVDIAVFYYATQLSWVGASLAGRQITPELWTKLSIIFAAVAAALINFFGYKFLVFKK